MKFNSLSETFLKVYKLIEIFPGKNCNCKKCTGKDAKMRIAETRKKTTEIMFSQYFNINR